MDRARAEEFEPVDGDSGLSELSGIRWSLSDVAPCGMRVFNRPCQKEWLEFDASNAPLASGCKPQSELVFVVEDEDEMRHATVELLEASGFEVVSCADSIEFERSAKQASSGCVVLDIRLRGSDGLSILERLKASRSPIMPVILSGLSDPVTAAECMKAGAHEYLAKPMSEMVLRRAVERAISASRMAYCRSQSRSLMAQLFDKLTPAEKTVADMLSRGYPTKSIAGELGRSENTIKIHRHRIMSKLKVTSTASIANMFNYLRDPD